MYLPYSIMRCNMTWRQANEVARARMVMGKRMFNMVSITYLYFNRNVSCILPLLPAAYILNSGPSCREQLIIINYSNVNLVYYLILLLISMFNVFIKARPRYEALNIKHQTCARYNSTMLLNDVWSIFFLSPLCWPRRVCL